MKERGIPFSTPMVRKILSGEKTQTRREVKHRHVAMIGPAGAEDDPDSWGYFAEGRDFSGWMVLARGVDERVGNNQDRYSIPCPYGEPRDRLWVREPWRTIDRYDHLPPSRIPDDAPIVYSTDGARWDGISGRYRHARFMPRRFARIVLEVFSVRVERLKSISEDDILAEAMTPWAAAELANVPPECIASLRDAWFVGWCAINGRESWDENPWCWAISFRRLRP